MKKITLLVALISAATFNTLSAQTTDPGNYCDATFDDMEGLMVVPVAIFSVSIGSLLNTTDAQYTAPHYVWYSNLDVPNFSQGDSENLTVVFDVQGGAGYGVWIDFNQDDVFAESEKISGTSGTDFEDGLAFAQDGNGTTITETITIPANASLGQTRMRVRIVEDDNYTLEVGYSISPCNLSDSNQDKMDWGETEDYTINITTATAGLEDVALVDSLIVFPNPVTSTLYIKQSIPSNSTYKIMSITGQKIQTGALNSSEKQINVSSLSEGIYFLQLFENNSALGQQKFIKSAQ